MGGLRELYRYQELLLRLHELGQEQAAMVADAELAEVMERLSRVTLEVASVEEAISRLKKEIKRLEGETAEEVYKRKQAEIKLYDGSVSSARELTQLQQKIREYQSFIDANEEKMLLLLEELEKREQEIVRVQAEKDELSAALLDLQEKHKARNLEYERKIALLEEEAAEVKKSIPEDLLGIYQKMARLHHGVAIAPLTGDVCGACRVSLSLSLLQRLRKGTDAYVNCENCGRLVFLP